MGKIFCIVGKSGSGKDTLYKAILKRCPGRLTPIIPCTTRPMREGEINGRDYFFVTEGELRGLESRGQVIEKREYHTVQGLWTYFTRRFSLMDGLDYIVISTLEGAGSFIRAFGESAVEVVYLDLPDGQRLRRCLDREDRQSSPDYAELCRRYLADERDFAPEKLAEIRRLKKIDASGAVDECLAQWAELFGS